MNGRQYILLFATIFLMFGLVSCVGIPEQRMDSAYVMVYDYDNNEVMDVSVYMDGKKLGRTDVYGRFSFPVAGLKERAVALELKKEGYEDSVMLTRIQEGQVFYFKIGTAAYYASAAEELLDEGKFSEAMSMINRALSVDERSDYQFLKTVIQKEVEE